MNMGSPLRGECESVVDDVSVRHELHSVHFFKDVGEAVWRVFGVRGEQAFRQSVEEGRGYSIVAALRNLDARLIAGPIDRPPFDNPEGDASAKPGGIPDDR